MLRENQNIVIQEAKQEINQLISHYKFYNDLKFTLDLNKLKDYSCNKFLNRTKSKANDPEIQAILNDIKTSIEGDYNHLYNHLNSILLSNSTFTELNTIIKIIQNPESDDFTEEEEEDHYGVFHTQRTACGSLNEEEEYIENDDQIQLIQDKINAFLDSHPEKMFFDKEKLRTISDSKTRLSEMISSLKAIRENPELHQVEEKEKPFSYVLSSQKAKSYSYLKSFSNIVKGNCFFISLFGHSKCVRNQLTLLTQDKSIKKHEVDDMISIYGPVDVISFAKNVPESFDQLTNFNIDIPNIYFFEISNEGKDPNYIELCNFISFISHITILCSETVVTKAELQHFNELSFAESKTNTLINCSPEKVFSLNFDNKSLDENELRKSIFKLLIEKKNLFIPFETACKYSQMFESKKIKNNDPKIGPLFEKDKINDYSLKMFNKARGYFDNMKKQLTEELYQISKEKKYIEDFHYNEQKVIEKVLRYFFVNINQTFWKNDSIIEISKVLVNDITKELKPFSNQIDSIELIGQLLQILSNNPKSFSKESKTILDKIQTKYPKLQEPKTPNEINDLAKKLKTIYDNLLDICFGEQELDDITDSISKEIFSFLNQNPIASDQEYGEFYSNLYKKYSDSSNYKMIGKYFSFILHIRKVPPEYRVSSFNIIIDEKSFKDAKVELDAKSKKMELTSGTTCHELYELVKKVYNLNNIPFHITTTNYDKEKNDYIVDIFDDNVPISKLKKSIFKVHYSVPKGKKSTATFLQSMIVAKEIKIADDFYIRTSSKEAIFNVKYQDNHDGWFNVPFTIETPNPEQSFGQVGGVLIYLKLSSKEMNYLKEGNTIIHQSYKNDSWVSEDDPIFLTYPKCNTAVVLLRHCSAHRVITLDTSINNLIPSQKKNTIYDRDWEGMSANTEFERGGKPYFVPVGYKAEGILVDSFNEDTCVAFHGTKARYVSSIISDRFKLPSERGGVEEDRIPLNEPYYGIENWAEAIFVSPSIKYAAFYSYNEESIIARTAEHNLVEAGHVIHDLVRLIVLQVRVNPSCTTYYPNTTPITPINDNYTDDQMEWRIASPADIFPYRLLTRDVPLRTFFREYRLRP